MKIFLGVYRAVAEGVQDAARVSPTVHPIRAAAFMCAALTAFAIIDPQGFVEEMKEAAAEPSRY